MGLGFGWSSAIAYISVYWRTAKFKGEIFEEDGCPTTPWDEGLDPLDCRQQLQAQYLRRNSSLIQFNKNLYQNVLCIKINSKTTLADIMTKQMYNTPTICETVLIVSRSYFCWIIWQVTKFTEQPTVVDSRTKIGLSRSETGRQYNLSDTGFVSVQTLRAQAR